MTDTTSTHTTATEPTPTHTGLARPAAIAMLEHNLWSMWAQFGKGRRCRLIDEPELLRFETPVAQTPYNAILRFRRTADPDETIDRVLDTYQKRNVPAVWWIHPTSQPHDLAGRLAARGLVEAENIPGMIATLDEIAEPGSPPPGITIEEVDLNRLDPFIDLITWRYQLPAAAATTLQSIIHAARFGKPGSPNRAWIARHGSIVIAKATLHLHTGVAGIYGVATRTEARRLGVARHLTLTALHAALANGARTAVLHSSPMAVGMYESIGFQHIANFQLYTPPNTLHL